MTSRGAESQEARAFLSSLPAPNERLYETEITRYVGRTPAAERSQRLASLLSLLLDDGADEKLRFAAFFALATFYRRSHDTTQLERLLFQWEERFSGSPLFDHVKALALNMRGGRSNRLSALDLVRRARGKWPHHVGIAHSFAETVAFCVYEKYHLPEKALLGEALRAVDGAIDEEPRYAKFHRTRGWLQFLAGDAEEGKQSFARAMDYEDSSESDYAIRIGSYQTLLDALNARQELLALRGVAESVREDLVHSRDRYLEFLGFFAGLLALMLGAISFASAHFTFREGYALILTLGGVLLVAFGGFGLLLQKGRDVGRVLVLLFLGLLLLSAGWFAQRW
jgi:hypothetical protein